jgi:hypothetical protein
MPASDTARQSTSSNPRDSIKQALSKCSEESGLLLIADATCVLLLDYLPGNWKLTNGHKVY